MAPPPTPQTLEEAIAIIQAQAARISQLEQRLQELEARLGQNSSNSSRPPSSDPPGTPPPASRKTPSGRKRGGQPGHDKHERTLVPPEQVDRMHVIKPDQCECCSKRLDSRHDQPWFERHQIFEVPQVRATVDEYQLYARCCDRCGSTTRAALPAGVARGQFGPRLQAIVTMCSGPSSLER